MTPYQQAIRDFMVGHLNAGARVACLIGGAGQDLEREMADIILREKLDIRVEAGLLDKSHGQRMGLAHLQAELEGRFAPRATLTLLTGHAGLVSPAGQAFMAANPAVRVGYVFRPTPDTPVEGLSSGDTTPVCPPRAKDPLSPENFRLVSPRIPR
jgi:hypothetical protein